MMQTMQVEGIAVHVQGSGPRTVVMLHGWPDTRRVWDGTVSALSGHHRCVTLTLPGFDQADAPAPHDPPTTEEMLRRLQAVLDAVSPSAPVTLLLHDWGCIFGYELAMRLPQRIEAVVAVDIGDYNASAYTSVLTPGQKMSVLGYQLWLALAWAVGRHVHGGLGNRMTRWMAATLRCPIPAADVRWQMNYPYAMRWFGLRGGLNTQQVALQCPVLYVFGEHKPFMFHSPRWVHTLRASEDGAAHGLRCGHWVMLEQAEAFHALLLRWLAGRERRKLARH